MDTRADRPSDRPDELPELPDLPELSDLPEPASPPLYTEEPSGFADLQERMRRRETPLEIPELSPIAPSASGAASREVSEARETDWTGDDALSEFPTESDVPRGRSVGLPIRAFPPWWPIAAAVLVIVLIGAAAWRWWPTGSRAAAAETGTISVETTPPGAAMAIDGRQRGATPLTLVLPVGSHTVTLTAGSARRDLSVTVLARTQVVHHVDLSQAAPAKTGRLQISGPAGAPIVLDGVRRGFTPAELSDVPAGEHAITVGEGATAVTQRVSVPAGGLASLLVPAGQAAGRQAAAWVSVITPIEVQVFDGGALVGNSTTSRILVLAGRHTLTLVNSDLGYRASRDVVVEPGRLVTIRLEPPNGVLHVNATPWAEVLLDGRSLGETPLANLAVPIGAHELTFRNPKFAEQKRSVVVSLTGPVRVGVDLRQ